MQEKQQPTFGSCRQLDGFEIGHVIAPPEAREISGGLEPLQVFSFLCVLMDWPLQLHNTTGPHAPVTEISIQISSCGGALAVLLMTRRFVLIPAEIPPQ